MNLQIDLCLNDIDPKKVKVSNSNGKKYVTIFCNKRQQPGQYGDTHSLTTGKNEAGEKVYCGSAKIVDREQGGYQDAGVENVGDLF